MKKLMKKSSKFLLGTIFSLLGSVVIFGASSYADTSCLDNYSNEEFQKIQSIKNILENNAGKFDEKFIKGKLSTLNFVTTIDNSLECRGGFSNFDEFEEALKTFVLSLSYRTIDLEPSDLSFENAEESLKQNIVEFIPWNFIDTDIFAQDSEINFSLNFEETDKTDKTNNGKINMDLSIESDGKYDKKNMKTDADVAVDFDFKGESTNEYSQENQTTHLEGNLDANILMKNKNIYIQFNSLNLDLGENYDLQTAMMSMMFDQIKNQIGDKFIHIPLGDREDEDGSVFLQNNGNFSFSLENFKDTTIFNFVKYNNKNTIQINKNICDILPIKNLNQVHQGNLDLSDSSCIDGIVALNHELLSMSTIEKIDDDERKLSGGNTHNSFMILRNEDAIEEVNIQGKNMTLKYKDNKFSFIAKDSDTGEEVFTLKGNIIPNEKIDLTFEFANNDKLNTFVGKILLDQKGKKNHALIEFGGISNEGFTTTSGKFKFEISELVKKITSFKVSLPDEDDIIEIEDLQSQFSGM